MYERGDRVVIKAGILKSYGNTGDKFATVAGYDEDLKRYICIVDVDADQDHPYGQHKVGVQRKEEKWLREKELIDFDEYME